MNQKQVTKALNIGAKLILVAIAAVFLWAVFMIGPHVLRGDKMATKTESDLEESVG